MVKLREHQKEGIKFLTSVRYGLLGDEMGTGKTLTALAGARILLRKRRVKQVLIIVPATLLDVWMREASRIGITPLLYHKTARKKKRKLLPKAQVILTTYHTAAQDIEYFGVLSERLLLVLDEGHSIKESNTRVSRAVKRIASTYRWLLTGTPVSNRPDDLFSLIEFLDPELSGSRKEWWNRFVKEKTVMIYTRTRGTLMMTKPVGVKDHAVPALNDLLGRVMLRRLKKDCLDLPRKQVIYQSYDPGPKVKRLINQTIVDLQDTGQQLSKILIRVQQVLDGILKHEDDEGTVISVDYHTPVKARLLREMLDNRSGRTIVWFRFRESLEYLKKVWKDLPIFTYTGSNAGSRDREIERWKESASGVLFATIRAAGVGLTLTEANTAIFYSAEFSPALNQQAEDRIHRMGQDNACTIYYLYGQRTIEEALVHLLKKKAKLNKAVVDGTFDRRELKLLYEYQLSLFENQKHYRLFMGESNDY